MRRCGIVRLTFGFDFCSWLRWRGGGVLNCDGNTFYRVELLKRGDSAVVDWERIGRLVLACWMGCNSRERTFARELKKRRRNARTPGRCRES
jgi:hypothetical protein